LRQRRRKSYRHPSQYAPIVPPRRRWASAVSIFSLIFVELIGDVLSKAEASWRNRLVNDNKTLSGR
jgi:hypothetical protein